MKKDGEGFDINTPVPHIPYFLGKTNNGNGTGQYRNQSRMIKNKKVSNENDSERGGKTLRESL